MKEERIVKDYDIVYIAEDGTQWDTKRECIEYEELLKDPSPIKALKFFDSDGNPLDVFALGEIPYFCYLVITHDAPKKYCWSVVKALIGSKDNVEISYDLPIYKGVYCNDWSNAYNGGYGYNGWKEQKSIKWLEETIQSYQKHIDFLKKIQKAS